jgi:hypothetical protein
MPIRHVRLGLQQEEGLTRNFGTLGQDVLRAFRFFTLDLKTISLAVGPSIAKSSTPGHPDRS